MHVLTGVVLLGVQVTDGGVGVTGKPLHWGHHHGPAEHVLLSGNIRPTNAWTPK